MKKYLFPLVLVLLLSISLTGCKAARTLDAAEDRIENHIESGIEQTLHHSIVTPAPDSLVHDSPSAEQITQRQAIDIALAHAGFAADTVQYLYAEFDLDDFTPKYEVNFIAEGVEYEYEIHGETGEILSFEAER